MEAKKTSNSQSNSEEKVQCWRHHNTWPQTILQSHNNKNSVVLAQTYSGRPIAQNRRFKHNPHTYSQLILNNGAQTHNGEKTAFSINTAGKTG
jgi:hypothetical protein